MAFLIDIVSVVGSILGAAIVLLVGYLVNGRFQRRLQRETTNYHAQLEAYKEVNRAAVRMMNALSGMRVLYSLTGKESYSDSELFDIAWQMGPAREAEAPLGTDAVQRMAKGLETATRDNEKSTQEWAGTTRIGLLNVYSRAFDYQRVTIETNIANANLVSDSPEVNGALGKFETCVTDYSKHMRSRIGSGMPLPDELTSEMDKVDVAWRRLTEVMRDELRETL